MTKAEAICDAKKDVQMYRQGGGWVISAYNASLGANVLTDEMPRMQALQRLTRKRTARALELLGYTDAAYAASGGAYGPGRVPERVDKALASDSRASTTARVGPKLTTGSTAPETKGANNEDHRHDWVRLRRGKVLPLLLTRWAGGLSRHRRTGVRRRRRDRLPVRRMWGAPCGQFPATPCGGRPEMKLRDERTSAQKSTHTILIGGTDRFMSGWGICDRARSYAFWACEPRDAALVEQWVRSRGDMSRVRTVSGDYRPPAGPGHCHVYVVDEDHPSVYNG